MARTFVVWAPSMYVAEISSLTRVCPNSDSIELWSGRNRHLSSQNLPGVKIREARCCSAGWGDNRFGQVGTNDTAAYVAAPTRIQGLPKIIAASAGDRHALALTDEGEVMAWGSNTMGQLGIERTGKHCTVGPAALANLVILCLPCVSSH